MTNAEFMSGLIVAVCCGVVLWIAMAAVFFYITTDEKDIKEACDPEPKMSPCPPCPNCGHLHRWSPCAACDCPTEKLPGEVVFDAHAYLEEWESELEQQRKHYGHPPFQDGSNAD